MTRRTKERADGLVVVEFQLTPEQRKQRREDNKAAKAARARRRRKQHGRQ